MSIHEPCETEVQRRFKGPIDDEPLPFWCPNCGRRIPADQVIQAVL